MSRDKIRIFDTTLRDGEQSPGCSMNVNEKVTLARQLERLGVEVRTSSLVGKIDGAGVRPGRPTPRTTISGSL